MPLFLPSYYGEVKNLVNYIQSSATAYCVVSGLTSYIHVESFGTGEIDDVAVTGLDEYPRVFLEQPFRCTLKPPTITWDVVLIVYDKILHERTDELDKQEITFDIANDLIQKIRQDKIYDLGDNINMMSLSEFSDDFTAGWRVEFQMVKNIPMNRCDILGNFTGTTCM